MDLSQFGIFAKAKEYAYKVAHPILRDMLSISRGQAARELELSYLHGMREGLELAVGKIQTRIEYADWATLSETTRNSLNELKAIFEGLKTKVEQEIHAQEI